MRHSLLPQSDDSAPSRSCISRSNSHRGRAERETWLWGARRHLPGSCSGHRDGQVTSVQITGRRFASSRSLLSYCGTGAYGSPRHQWEMQSENPAVFYFLVMPHRSKILLNFVIQKLWGMSFYLVCLGSFRCLCVDENDQYSVPPSFGGLILRSCSSTIDFLHKITRTLSQNS